MVSSLTASSQFPHILPSPHHTPPTRAARVMSVKLDSGPITSLFKTPQHPNCPTFYHACLLTQQDCPPLTCPPSPGADNPYSLCSTHTTTFQPLEPTKVISAPGPLHLQSLLSEVLFPSLHSLSTLSLSCTSPKSSFLVIQRKEPP